MFSLYGFQESIKNVYLLSKKYIKNNTISNTNDLKNYYLEFLFHHQPWHFVNKEKNVFISDNKIETSLQKNYQLNTELNDINQNKMVGNESYTVEEKSELKKLILSGYNLLVKNNKEIKYIFDLVIHSIFFRKTSLTAEGIPSYGGSSSNAMGTIWYSGYGKFNESDVAEFLLHELAHHLLFIDERCHAQFFYDKIILPENYAQSAILVKKRPLDKVVHSVVVSTEILLARSSFLKSDSVSIHPNSKIMLDKTLSSIDSVFNMKKLDHIITQRSIDILFKCQNSLREISLESCA